MCFLCELETNLDLTVAEQSEVEERIARIKTHKGVKGLIIVKKTEQKEGN